MAKWVYRFGDGKAEGSAAMKELLGGKGANLAEMASLGLPVPPGFTITTEVCTYFYANDRTYPPDLKEEVEAALGVDRRQDRPHLRRPQRAAARLRPLRRARVDAGHDGHRPQPRPERRDRAWRSPRAPIRASPGIPTAASSRCTEAWCSASSTTSSRRSWSSSARSAARPRTPTSTPTAGRRSSALYKKLIEDTLEKPFPQAPSDQLWGAIGAVFGSWMNARAHRLPPAPRHPGELGHRRQRAGDGVRQHGRHLRHRRRLHAQSLDRREGALRRVPGQRAGRGRGRRHPHAAGSDRGGAARLRARRFPRSKR